MKKFTLIYIFSLFATLAFAKQTITLRLILPKENSNNNYFFASNLNGWNPASKEYQF